VITKKSTLDVLKINGRTWNGKILGCVSNSKDGTVELVVPIGGRVDKIVRVSLDKKDFRALVRGV